MADKSKTLFDQLKDQLYAEYVERCKSRGVKAEAWKWWWEDDADFDLLRYFEDHYETWMNDLAAAQKRVVELEAALKPFATAGEPIVNMMEHYRAYFNLTDGVTDDAIMENYGIGEITIGMLLDAVLAFDK